MIKMIIAYIFVIYFFIRIIRYEIKRNIKEYNKMKELKQEIESGIIDHIDYNDNGTILVIWYKNA